MVPYHSIKIKPKRQKSCAYVLTTSIELYQYVGVLIKSQVEKQDTHLNTPAWFAWSKFDIFWRLIGVFLFQVFPRIYTGPLPSNLFISVLREQTFWHIRHLSIQSINIPRLLCVSRIGRLTSLLIDRIIVHLIQTVFVAWCHLANMLLCHLCLKALGRLQLDKSWCVVCEGMLLPRCLVQYRKRFTPAVWHIEFCINSSKVLNGSIITAIFLWTRCQLMSLISSSWRRFDSVLWLDLFQLGI